MFAFLSWLFSCGGDGEDLVFIKQEKFSTAPSILPQIANCLSLSPWKQHLSCSTLQFGLTTRDCDECTPWALGIANIQKCSHPECGGFVLCAWFLSSLWPLHVSPNTYLQAQPSWPHETTLTARSLSLKSQFCDENLNTVLSFVPSPVLTVRLKALASPSFHQSPMSTLNSAVAELDKSAP